MTRLLLITLLLLSSSPAYAEWLRIGENDRSVGWADTAIHRSGDMVEMWVLFDYSPYKTRHAAVNGISRRKHSMKSIVDLSVNGCFFSRGMPRKWVMVLLCIPEENLLTGSRQILQGVMQTRFGGSPAAESKNNLGVLYVEEL